MSGETPSDKTTGQKPMEQVRPRLQPTAEQQEKFNRTITVARLFHQANRLMNTLNVIALVAAIAAFFVVQLAAKKTSIYAPAMSNLFILVACTLATSIMCFQAMRTKSAEKIPAKREQLAQNIRWVALIEIVLLTLSTIIFIVLMKNHVEALISGVLSALVAAQLQFVLRLSAKKIEIHS